MTTQTIKQLPNGKWTHSKTACEFDDETGARTDYHFSCEWEGVPCEIIEENSFR